MEPQAVLVFAPFLFLAVLVAVPSVLIVWTALMLRGRPSWRRVAVWAVGGSLAVASVYGALSASERRPHVQRCEERWDQAGGFDLAGVDTKAEYLRVCVPAERKAMAERRADPDASCDWEDSSACPETDLRSPWLFVSAITGAGGLVHIASSRRTQPLIRWRVGTD